MKEINLRKKVKKWVINCKIVLYLLISFVLFRQSVLSIVKVNATTEKALAIIILFRPTKKWFERMNYLSWLVSRNVVPQKCKKKLNNLQRDPFFAFYFTEFSLRADVLSKAPQWTLSIEVLSKKLYERKLDRDVRSKLSLCAFVQEA